MTTYKLEPILLVPSLVDEDCRRFCFESCRLYDQLLRNVCVAVQRECDCAQKKIANPNTQLDPFLSKVPKFESCKKYCRKGSCQKYFKLDSSTFSECVGAIILCSCSSTIRRFHPELTSVKISEHVVSEPTYSTSFFITVFVILIVCLVIAILGGLHIWKSNNGRRIGVLVDRLQPNCNTGNEGGNRQDINAHEDVGIGTDDVSSNLRFNASAATSTNMAKQGANVTALLMENQINNNSISNDNDFEVKVKFKANELLNTGSSCEVTS